MSLELGRSRAEVVSRILETLQEIFGPSFPAVLRFHLRKWMGEGGMETLWDRPKEVFEALSRHRTGEEGAVWLIYTWITSVKEGEEGRRLAMELVEAMKRGDVEAVRSILVLALF